MCCHARVLRVEQGSGNDFGVAAEIRRMDILPEIPPSFLRLLHHSWCNGNPALRRYTRPLGRTELP